MESNIGEGEITKAFNRRDSKQEKPSPPTPKLTRPASRQSPSTPSAKVAPIPARRKSATPKNGLSHVDDLRVNWIVFQLRSHCLLYTIHNTCQLIPFVVSVKQVSVRHVYM